MSTLNLEDWFLFTRNSDRPALQFPLQLHDPNPISQFSASLKFKGVLTTENLTFSRLSDCPSEHNVYVQISGHLDKLKLGEYQTQVPPSLELMSGGGKSSFKLYVPWSSGEQNSSAARTECKFD